MRKGGGKSKGNSFERVVAGLMDKWWNVPAKTFWRTTNSGGWVEFGDIAPRLRQNEEPIFFPFVVECKAIKDLDLSCMFKKSLGSRWNRWLKQLEKEKKDAEAKFPGTGIYKRLLIFKKNNASIFCVFFISDGFLPFFTTENKGIKYLRITSDMHICLLSDFMKTYTKEYMYNWYRRSSSGS